MGEHAILSPSASERWMACPGSIDFTADALDTSSVYAEEGTLAHSIAALLIVEMLGQGAVGERMTAEEAIELFMDEDVHADMYASALEDVSPRWRKEFATMPDDMMDAVEVFLRECESYMLEYPDAVFLVEQRVYTDKLVHTECHGTGDFIMVHPSLLLVLDYKHGQGKYVSEQDNSQLDIYAIATYQTHAKKHKGKVRRGICQPRVAGTEAVRYAEDWTISDLKARAKEIAVCAKEAMAPDAPLNAGSWCKWCPRAGDCVALATYSLGVAQAEFAEFIEHGITEEDLADDRAMDSRELVQCFENLAVLRSWADAVETRMLARMLEGEDMPGYRVGQGNKHRAYRDKKRAEKLARELLGKDAFKEVLLTPKQMLAALSKIRSKDLEAKKEEMESLVYLPEGGPKIVTQDSNARPYDVGAEADFREYLMGLITDINEKD